MIPTRFQHHRAQQLSPLQRVVGTKEEFSSIRAEYIALMLSDGGAIRDYRQKLERLGVIAQATQQRDRATVHRSWTHTCHHES